MQSVARSPFHGIGYKSTDFPRDFGGRTRSGGIYNIGRADVVLRSYRIPATEVSRDKADTEALKIGEQMDGGAMRWTNGQDIGDAFSKAKALCNVAREWREALLESRTLCRVLTTFAQQIRAEVEAGVAFFYSCREEFVDRYTINLCDMIIGSSECGDWSWTKEDNLVYW